MKYLAVAALALASFMGASAQERILSEAEYNEVVSRAEKGLTTGARGPFRLLVETDVTNEGLPNLDYRLRSLALFVPGQGQHRTEERIVGGQATKSEVITLNDRSFSRGLDGKWTVLERKENTASAGRSNASGDSQKVMEETQYRYLGSETYAGRRVEVYTKTERSTKRNSKTGTTSESDGAVTIRLTAEGDYFRYESNVKTLTADRRGTIKIVTEIYSDPTIALKVPIAVN